MAMTWRSKRILFAALLETLKGQVKIPDSGAIRLQMSCGSGGDTQPFIPSHSSPPLTILHHLRLDHRRPALTFQHICHFTPGTIAKGCHQMSHRNVERVRLQQSDDLPFARPSRRLCGGRGSHDAPGTPPLRGEHGPIHGAASGCAAQSEIGFGAKRRGNILQQNQTA